MKLCLLSLKTWFKSENKRQKDQAVCRVFFAIITFYIFVACSVGLELCILTEAFRTKTK
jgi:hypothetical protein